MIELVVYENIEMVENYLFDEVTIVTKETAEIRSEIQQEHI